jgi:SAM-dependent methyltransferase
MFGTRKEYKYYKCSNCGVLQIENPIYNSELLYPSSYYSFSSNSMSFKNTIKKLVFKNTVSRELGTPTLIANFFKIGVSEEARAIKPYINKSMSILDVGSGSGELLEALYNLGYNKLEGIDPYLSTAVNHVGWSIKNIYITDLQEDKKYDLIMLHHSFEHMDNPKEVLVKIKSLLSVNGKCIIRIPVCDSYAYETYKNDWVQIDAPRHIYIHTNKSMKLLCENAGLRIEKIKDDSKVFQFIGSEQYKKNICLNSSESFYKPFSKRIFSKNLFSKKDLNFFRKKTEDVNKLGSGDQRIFILY